MGKEELHPVHPGEVILEEFLKPMGLSQERLALDISVPPRRIKEIVLGKRSITADTAIKWAGVFIAIIGMYLAFKGRKEH